MRQPYKKKNTSALFTFLAFLTFELLPWSALQGEESVVIEGGPNKVQLSDEDGQIEPRVPGETPMLSTQENATAMSAPLNRPGAVGVEPIPGSNVTVRVPSANPEESLIKSLEPGGTPELKKLDVRKQVMLNEIADEIGLSVSANQAKITFEADYLFGNETEELTSASKTVLGKMSDYMRQSNRTEAIVFYRYDSEDENAVAAKVRATKLADFLKSSLSAEEAKFTIMDPQVVEEIVPEAGQATEAFREVESLVDIVLK